MAKKQTETSDVQEVSSAELDDEESLTGKETQVLEKKKKKTSIFWTGCCLTETPLFFFLGGLMGKQIYYTIYSVNTTSSWKSFLCHACGESKLEPRACTQQCCAIHGSTALLPRIRQLHSRQSSKRCLVELEVHQNIRQNKSRICK